MAISTSIRGAVLDLGSNSFKIMLAEQRGNILTLFKEKAEVTRLGHSVALSGELHPKAIKRSLKVLNDYRKEVENFQPEQIVITGTSAFRTAINREVLLLAIRELFGTSVKVLSGSKEGKLIYQGLSTHSKWAKQNLINLDLGGGSIEIIHGRNGKALASESFTLGCVRMRDLFFDHQPIHPTAILRAKRQIVEVIHKATEKYAPLKMLLTATGGSMGNLCAIFGMRNKKKLGVEGFSMSYDDMNMFLDLLAPLSLKRLRAVPGMPADRADLMVPALVVFTTCMELLKAPAIHYASRGLRYGLWKEWICNTPFDRIISLEGKSHNPNK